MEEESVIAQIKPRPVLEKSFRGKSNEKLLRRPSVEVDGPLKDAREFAVDDILRISSATDVSSASDSTTVSSKSSRRRRRRASAPARSLQEMSSSNTGLISSETAPQSPTLWSFPYFTPVLPGSASSSSEIEEDIRQKRKRTLLRQWASTAMLLKKYRMGEVLGTGADAQVVKAVRRSDNFQFALKVIDLKRPQQGSRFRDTHDQEKRDEEEERQRSFMARAERMRRELEIHLKLPAHPHIVECVEVFAGTRKSHLVLGLCTGGTLLDQVCSENGSRLLTTRGAAKIAKQVLEAVHFLHMNGVVHRDLKLENLLLKEPLQPQENSIAKVHLVLVDFGSARYLRRRNVMERKATAHVGTLAYMAPEQHTGGTVDAALDLWSFGIVLAALCTGRHPLRDVPRPRWHEEMQRDRLPDGASPQANKDWAQIPEARDLAKGCLRLRPSDRLTASRALEHVWITRNTQPPSSSEDSSQEQGQTTKHALKLRVSPPTTTNRVTIKLNNGLDDDENHENDTNLLDITRDSDFILQQQQQEIEEQGKDQIQLEIEEKIRPASARRRRRSFYTSPFLCCRAPDDVLIPDESAPKNQTPLEEDKEVSLISPDQIHRKEAFADSESLPRGESPHTQDEIAASQKGQIYMPASQSSEDVLRLPRVLEGLREVQRSKLQKTMLLVVAMRAEDVEVRRALDLFDHVAKEKKFLTRDDVQRALLGGGTEDEEDEHSGSSNSNGITLRAADELCAAFEDLSIDGSGRVSSTEFIAGVLSLRRRSRYDLAQPILRDLDPSGSGRVDAKAFASLLRDVRDKTSAPEDSAGSTLSISLPPDEDINTLVNTTLGPDESLSYDEVVDLLFKR